MSTKPIWDESTHGPCPDPDRYVVVGAISGVPTSPPRSGGGLSAEQVLQTVQDAVGQPGALKDAIDAAAASAGAGVSPQEVQDAIAAASPDTGWRDISALCTPMLDGGVADDDHLVHVLIRRIRNIVYLDLYGRKFGAGNESGSLGSGFSPVIRPGWPTFRFFPIVDQVASLATLNVSPTTLKFQNVQPYEIWGGAIHWITEDAFPDMNALPGVAVTD